MNRRNFIAGLGSAVAFPLIAGAQQSAIPVIGLLSGATSESGRDLLGGFYLGLSESGFIVDRDVAIEYRWAEGNNERLADLAIDLVRRQVAAIVVLDSTPGAIAAKAATDKIPIVFIIGTNPVATGLVASLARPGGNLTGVTGIVAELMVKRLALIRELAPSSDTVAVLINPTNRLQAETETRDVQEAARSLGLRVVILNVSRPSEFETAFEALVTQKSGALLVSGETFFLTQRKQIIALAARHAVPTIYAFPAFATDGGLITYGPNDRDMRRIAGVYTGRVLRGEKPADLPVQQPAKFDLRINLKAAKALGLAIPPKILALADEVIE
jgi:putative tryptophan/tyrosine transport system substrate-binding protein